jgi:hypothetical protein
MTQVEIVLVFDTEDEDGGGYVTEQEIEAYAEDLNLETARAMVGYQGWRVQTPNRGVIAS